MITLVDLQNFDAMEVDPDQLREKGIPDGYVIASEVLVKEWILAGQLALGGEQV